MRVRGRDPRPFFPKPTTLLTILPVGSVVFCFFTFFPSLFLRSKKTQTALPRICAFAVAKNVSRHSSEFANETIANFPPSSPAIQSLAGRRVMWSAFGVILATSSMLPAAGIPVTRNFVNETSFPVGLYSST